MLENLMMLAQDGDAAAAGALGFGLVCMGLSLLISLASIGLVIYALIDAIKNPAIEDNRIVWILVILFVGPIGALIYLFIGRK